MCALCTSALLLQDEKARLASEARTVLNRISERRADLRDQLQRAKAAVPNFTEVRSSSMVARLSV